MALFFTPYPVIYNEIPLARLFRQVLGQEIGYHPDGSQRTVCPWCPEGEISIDDGRFRCRACSEEGTVLEAAALHMQARSQAESALWLVDRFELPVDDYLFVRKWRARQDADWEPNPEEPESYLARRQGRYAPYNSQATRTPAAGPFGAGKTPSTAEQLVRDCSAVTNEPDELGVPEF
jgi:hypothetical protein